MAACCMDELLCVLKEKSPVPEKLDRCLRTFDFILPKSSPPPVESEINPEDAIKCISYKLAKHLNLGLDQCEEMTCQYLLFEYCGSERNMGVILGDTHLLAEFLALVAQFWYNHLCVGFECVNLLISWVTKEESPAQAIAQRYLCRKFVNESVLEVLCGQLTQVSNRDGLMKSLPLDVIFRLEHAISVALLSSLVNVQQTVENRALVIATVQKCSFGALSDSQLVSEESMETERVIGYILTICVLLALALDDQETQTIPNEWCSINKELENLSLCKFDHFCGVINLGWALKAHATGQQSNIIMKRSSLAQSNNAGAQLSYFMKHSLVKCNTDLHKMFCSAVYVVMDNFLSLFEAESLAPTEVLSDILSECLCDEDVSSLFWENEANGGVFQYVHESIKLLPIIYEPNLRILQALVSAGEASCQRVVSLLDCVPSFTENADRISSANLAEEGDPNDAILKLTSDRQPYAAHPEFIVPCETLGMVSRRGIHVIQWQLNVSGWQIFLMELKQCLNEGQALGRAQATISLVANVVAVIPDCAQEMAHFLQTALNTLQRIQVGSDSVCELCVQCLNCLTAAVAHNGQQVMLSLTSCNIVPLSVDSTDSLMERLINHNIANQYFDETLAALKLVLKMAENKSIELKSLEACVKMILDSIFSQLGRLHMQIAHQKDDIVYTCVQIINALLARLDNIICYLRENSGWLIECVCNDGSVRIVLEVCSIGCAPLISLSRAVQTRSRVDVNIGVVAVCLSVVNQLLDGEHAENVASLLVQPLTISEKKPLVILCEYVMCAVNNGAMCTLALMIIRKLATLMPTLLMSSLQQSAGSLRDAVVYRLQSPGEDSRVRVQCVSLVNACIAHQPAFAQLLLDDHNNESCINAIFKVLLIVCEELLWRKEKNESVSSELSNILDTQSGLLTKERINLLYDKLQQLLRSKATPQSKMDVLKNVRAFVFVLVEMAALEPDCETCQMWVKRHSNLMLVAVQECDVHTVNTLVYVGETEAKMVHAWHKHIQDWEDVITNVLTFHRQLRDHTNVTLPAETLARLMVPLIHNILQYEAKEIQDRRVPLVELLCRLLNAQLTAFMQGENSKSCVDVCCSTVCCLSNATGKCLQHCSHVFTNNSTLRNCVSLLEIHSTNGSLNSSFYQSVLVLAAQITHFDKAFPLILSSKLCEFVCLDGIEMLNKNGCQQIMQHLLLFYRQGLINIGVRFVPQALDFLGSHSDILYQVLNSFCTETSILCVHFLLEMSAFKDEWSSQLHHSVTGTLECVSRCCRSLIVSLSKPKMQRGILKKRSRANCNSPESSIGPPVEELHLLFYCIQFLRAFSLPIPTVSQQFQVVDVSKYLGVVVSELGSGDEDGGVTLGGLLSAVHMCAGALRRAQPRASSPSAHRVTAFSLVSDKQVIKCLLESTTDLILSECLCIVLNPQVSSNHKQLIRRELGAELEPLISRCVRYAGGSPSGSTPRPSPSTYPPSTLFDLQYLTNVHEILNQITSAPLA